MRASILVASFNLRNETVKISQLLSVAQGLRPVRSSIGLTGFCSRDGAPTFNTCPVQFILKEIVLNFGLEDMIQQTGMQDHPP